MNMADIRMFIQLEMYSARCIVHSTMSSKYNLYMMTQRNMPEL